MEDGEKGRQWLFSSWQGMQRGIPARSVKKASWC